MKIGCKKKVTTAWYCSSTSPNMYRYLPRYGKAENENMQNYALNLVNFGAHLSKILKYDIP